jgi:Peptidase family M1 domain/Secretion system C-terminal sorting domain
MKRKLYLLTAVLFFIQSVFAQDSIRQSYHRRTADQPGNTPTVENSTGNSGTGANIDVVYYRCDWTIDPSTSKNIAGTVTTYFKTTTTNVSQITFDLNNTVFGAPVAKYHGITCVSSFPSTDIFRMTLPAAIAVSGTLDSVSITYSGTPPAVNSQEEGFQRGELPAASGNWYIYTLSESYEERDWWPSKSDMQDKADSLDINVTVPNTYWVAANGILVDSAINGANRTFKYKHRYPIATYLVGIGIAKYNRQYRGTVNISGTNVPVAYYTYPNMTGATLTTAIAAMDVSKSELVQFSNKYGPYPFANEKHGYYQHNWGGGIEHQTFSGMSGGSMASWSVIAHELAHQWFGDKVTFATWNHLWLAEGFAKYSEALAVELIPGIGGTATDSSWRRSIKITARALTTTPVVLSAASIVNSNTIWTTNNDDAVYQRGAMVVSMLRTMMGDAKFFQGCKDYISDPLLAYKSATTADLQRNMENQMSGINLTPFFNAWAVGAGTPDYTGQYYINGNTIQFTLSQTRTPGATPFMPMPVAIRIRNAANTKDTNIVIYHYSATQLGYAGDQYGVGIAGQNYITYNLSFTPSVATIDPAHKTMASGTLTLIGTPLDVSILNFSASKGITGNKVNLSLANNETIDKVVLLKSSNGTDFTDAGVMTKINTSGLVNDYQFTDALPFASTTFYRAKIYTQSKVQYSAIVKIQNTVSREITVSPNPASDVININFSNNNREKTTIVLTNAEGKKVVESSTSNDFIHFDISDLPSGMYVVQIVQNGQVAQTSKFLVRH